MQAGIPWQAVVDRVRPHVAALYRRLSPPRDRARFVRHVRPYWDVFRHRSPRESLDRLRDWTERGRLDKLAARVTVLGTDGPLLRVSIAERTGVTRVESFDAVVRCIGPALTVTDGESPLICSLVEAGLARRRRERPRNRHTDGPRGRILDAGGHASPHASSPSARFAARPTGRRRRCPTSPRTHARSRRPSSESSSRGPPAPSPDLARAERAETLTLLRRFLGCPRSAPLPRPRSRGAGSRERREQRGLTPPPEIGGPGGGQMARTCFPLLSSACR